MPHAATDRHAPLNAPLSDAHRLSWFADIVALPGPDKVISIGDILMIAGLAGVILFGAAPVGVRLTRSTSTSS